VVVRSYYADIAAGNYRVAWHRLAPGVQSSFGGYTSWRAGYNTTTATAATRIRITSFKSGAAAMNVTVKASDTDACGNDVNRRFRGTWQLERNGGRWTATQISMTKASGAEPINDASACPPTQTDTTTAPSPSSGCDPNYEGACLDPNSPDYDCEGGSGNGPDYVQGPITVVGDDHYGLDANSDGTGCE
jgi:hypothetical protein